VAMEPPASMEAESLRDEKVKVLKSIRPIPKAAVHAHAFRAQYAKGTIEGNKVKGYLEEDYIPPDSITETYAAMKLFIDNWRWRGVPFYLRTGKRMAKAQSAISIAVFSRYPCSMHESELGITGHSAGRMHSYRNDREGTGAGNADPDQQPRRQFSQ
jgi:glucose-6-phosphate 1-dehydrogenase